MKPEVLVFDFFDVIAEDVGKKWMNEHCATPEARREVLENIFWPVDLGEISEEEFYGKLARISSEDPIEIRKRWLSTPIKEDTVVLIRQLASRYRLAVCSNAVPWHFYSVLERSGIGPLFEQVVVSAEIKVKKPDPKIFEHTLAKLGVAPATTLFTDDKPVNVEAAKALGMQGIVFTDAASFERDLTLFENELGNDT